MEIGVVRTFFIGGLAGAASVFGNTPIDVIKTRMQVRLMMSIHCLCLTGASTNVYLIWLQLDQNSI